MWRLLLLSWSILWCLPAQAAAPCDDDLISAQGQNGYKSRAGGFCEGLYVPRVGASPVELVSLTRGDALPRLPPASLSLTVSSSHGPKAAHLRGLGIPNGLNYRLDALVTPGRQVSWPADRVLGAADIPLSDVGLFAFVEDDTGTAVYIPVTIGHGAGGSGMATAMLRTADLVEDLRWRFVPDAGSVSKPVGWTDIGDSQDRITVVLPAGAGLLEVGWSDPQSGSPREASFRVAD